MDLMDFKKKKKKKKVQSLNLELSSTLVLQVSLFF